MYVSHSQRRHNRVSGSLELELQMFESHHMGAETQTWVLCRASLQLRGTVFDISYGACLLRSTFLNHSLSTSVCSSLAGGRRVEAAVSLALWYTGTVAAVYVGSEHLAVLLTV